MQKSWFQKSDTKADVFTFSLRVNPNASRTRIVGLSCDGSCLQIAISAPPVEGAANLELVAFLAKQMKVKKSSVCLLRGETSRVKVVQVSGIAQDDVLRLIADVA